MSTTRKVFPSFAFACFAVALVALCGCTTITQEHRAEIRTTAEEALTAASDLDRAEWAAEPETRKALADVRATLEGGDELVRDRKSLRAASQRLRAGVHTIHSALLRQDFDLPNKLAPLLRYLDCRAECELNALDCQWEWANANTDAICSYEVGACRMHCVWKYDSAVISD